MPCYVCEQLFVPDANQMKAWAESGRPFDPLDWECGDCDVIDYIDHEEVMAADCLEDSFDKLMDDLDGTDMTLESDLDKLMGDDDE